jgi:hypothetical protein
MIFSFAQQQAAHGGTAIPSPLDWSPDGRFLIYHVVSPSTGFDLWALPMAGNRKPFPALRSLFTKIHANFSPDGKWIAYTSDESGAYEVYFEAFPDPERASSGQRHPAGKWQISTKGGSEPRWRSDGRELYYLAPDRMLMAVPVQTGTPFQAGVPKALFQTRVPPGVNPNRRGYVPAAGGQRFLVNTLVEEPRPSPITVVLNWTAGLGR